MFGNLFRRKSSEERQVAGIFERLNEFLRDDARQNAALPDEVRSMVEAGPAIDQLPDAAGEFGHDVRNPVPVNGPVGEALYLSSLSPDGDQFIFAHRLGSKGKIDVFETVSADGRRWDLLFLSLYHPRKSRKAPAGYSFRPLTQPPFFCASTTFVSDFPHQMRAALSQLTQSILGFPIVSREIREAIEQGTFTRPAQHAARLEALKLDGKTQTAPDERVPLLLQHVEAQAQTLAAVLEQNIGCAALEREEVLFFCAATACYAYRHYGRGKADERFLEKFASELAANCTKQSRSFGQALQEYRSRYAEYGALYDALFEPGKDDKHKRHWLVTMMMHLVERATGRTAEGYMVKIAANSPVIAAVFDDAFKLARGGLSA